MLTFQIIVRDKKDQSIKDIHEFNLDYTKARKFDGVSQYCLDLALSYAIHGLDVSIEFKGGEGKTLNWVNL